MTNFDLIPDVLDIQDKAVAVRLAPLRKYLEDNEVLVRALPQTAREFADTSDTGDMYFVLSESEYQEPEGMSFVGAVQEGLENLAIYIQLPERYGKKSCYDVYKIACSLLLGWRPPHAKTPISLRRRRFTIADSNWMIEAIFQFRSTIHQQGEILIEDNQIERIELDTDLRKVIIQ